MRDWGDYALDLEDVLAVTPREPEAAEDSDGEETAVQTLNGALVAPESKLLRGLRILDR